MRHPRTLIVIVGPTAVGKTGCSLHVAKTLGCEIISADSRQMYRKLSIGTAAPTNEELESVKHHFVGFLEPDAYYNASDYEHDVLNCLDSVYKKQSVAVLVGGSMLYIDAIVNGIDLMPNVDPEVRDNLYNRFKSHGIEPLRLQLKQVDPTYYAKIDLKNHVRVIHALEVFLTTGKPFSSYHTHVKKDRPFNTIKIGLELPRDVLYSLINQRVIQMVEMGLVDEVRGLSEYKHCNGLNTVGYKEIFDHLDGKYSLDRAIELIQRNSRHYAKKQMTWFKRDAEIRWFNPDEKDAITDYCISYLHLL
jgi:tRNA dimethylallyltransferase